MTTFCPYNCLNPPWHTFYEHCKTRRVLKSTLNSTKKSCDLSLFLVIFVRISSVALRFGSEMDSYRRDLTNILHSYLVSDSFGPVLGARAWSCKTANDYLGLSQLRNTLETFGGRCLRLPPGLSMFYITFLLYGLLGLTILDHIYSSFL